MATNDKKEETEKDEDVTEEKTKKEKKEKPEERAIIIFIRKEYLPAAGGVIIQPFQLWVADLPAIQRFAVEHADPAALVAGSRAARRQQAGPQQTGLYSHCGSRWPFYYTVLVS